MRQSRRSFSTRSIPLLLAFTGCVAGDDATETGSQLAAAPPAPAVGLAIEVDNGVPQPLSLKKGQTYYLNQIDLRAQTTATFDEGVMGLRTRGDFAGFQWAGVRLEDTEFILLSNADGTFTRRRFYRDAKWMNATTTFTLEQLDSRGRTIGASVGATTGDEFNLSSNDTFFDRRLRAIQWTNDCASTTDCSAATNFMEEALVELRYAQNPGKTFALDSRTMALRLTWSLGRTYTFPVTQVVTPAYAYGFSIDLAPVTPPRADGTYAPGSDVTFRITLRDGAGTALHDPGAMPSYNEVIFGPNPAGIQYYRAFFDPTTTYWRRKHRERMLMVEFLGPAQNAQAIRSIIDLDKFLNADDVQTTGTFAADGVYAQFHTFPTAHDLFGGAFEPDHHSWDNPVPDTWTHHIPADAPSGTYYVNAKGRRTFMGQDIPFTRTLEVQVGTNDHTTSTLGVSCNTCHSGERSLSKVLHANANVGTCAGCHVPLGFELEGPIYVRTHFIHSRSRRFDVSLDNCSACHTTAASIQRTSKSACLSCHTSYPADHVATYGPIESIYVGGGRESFQQCSSTCHVTHPRSGL
jgi:hypothetical protein